MYEWEKEPWYAEHKARWDAMKLKGWRFDYPEPMPNRVGLTMRRGLDHYTWYIAKDQKPEEIHRQLLEGCEYHAAHAMENTMRSL